MSPTLTTFLFEAANFLVLAAALSWLLFKPVRQALADRREKFEADNRQATQILAEAQKTQQEINETRTRLQAELGEMRTRELETARQQAEQILNEARSVAVREREMSHRLTVQVSDTQRDMLAEVSAAAAADMVGRLLIEIGGPALQSALVASACKQLRSLPQSGISPVKVESSQPLSPEQLASLKDALGAAAATVDFRMVDGLGDGVRVLTGKGLIDASVGGIVQFASQSLVKEMSRRANNHNPLHRINDA
ncbi:MAG: ATP synthase F0 subunit B [Pirellulaceae bacterium]